MVSNSIVLYGGNTPARLIVVQAFDKAVSDATRN